MKVAVIALALFAACVSATSPPPSYAPAPVYPDTPPTYQYQYAVADDYAGLNFGANEARDGYATSGEYTVALPDGRIQTVKYTVSDAQSGYIADVTYTGEAKYEPYKPAPSPPAYRPAPPPPAYKPAPPPPPAYKPAN